MIAFLRLTAFAAQPPEGGWPPPPETGEVASVYDGDTVTLKSGDKIRLRWVNTPELKPAEAYGLEAKKLAEELVLGEEITLITNDDPRDGYGRIVAGVRTGDKDLSVELLEQGLAHLFIIPPDDTDLSAMVAAQGRAQAAKLGIWSTDRYQGALHITSFHANARGDDNENVNGEYARICNVSAKDVNLKGYVITDDDDHKFVLPDVVIPVGHTFQLHSGLGDHQTDPKQQIKVQLGSERPVWNNDGDILTILDATGTVVDRRAHGDKAP